MANQFPTESSTPSGSATGTTTGMGSSPGAGGAGTSIGSASGLGPGSTGSSTGSGYGGASSSGSSSFGSGLGVVQQAYSPALAPRPIDHLLGRRQFFRAGEPELEVEAHRRMHP